MIKNISKYKKNEGVYKLLQALEKALKNKDSFSVSVLITRLKREYNLSIEVA